MSRVLVIGDTHCPGMLPRYPNFLRKVYDKHKCNRVVHIGDLVDNGAISFHEKSPSLSSAKEERKKALRQIARLYQAFPEADWIIGNHDALTQRQAAHAGVPEEYLRDYTEIWNVSGWTAHPRFSRVTIDGVVYAHGDSGKGGMYASVRNSRDNFCSWVQGHGHAEGGVWYTTTEHHRIFGMNVGSGMDHQLLQFEYGRKFNRKPTLGCGVVLNGTHAIFEPM